MVIGIIMIRVLHFNTEIHPYDVVDTALTRIDSGEFAIQALTGVRAPVAGDYEVGSRYPIKHAGYVFSRRNYPWMLKLLIAEIRRFRPDIIHAHGFDPNVVACVAARITGVPCYIIGRHYSDHIYFLATGIKRRLYLAVESMCNKAAIRIAVPTDQVRSLLIDRQKVPESKIALIPFGIDFDKYRASSPGAPAQLRQQFGLGDKRVILTCSRLNKEKGLEYFLTAIARVKLELKDFHVVLVGSGPFEAELRRLTRDLNLDDIVTFVGWRTDAMDWIATADLFVHPAFCESWCQVLFEALAFGKPVIMTPVGAAPEVIGNNERGRLVPLGNSDAIANAITELLQNASLRQRLGALGKEYIFTHMAADAAARRYEGLYRDSLAQVRG
jgi:glycosyltransferase involved in cell wall biosynthesis